MVKGLHLSLLGGACVTLSAGSYLAGALELAVIVGALAFAAWRVRGLVLGGWSGPPARVAEAVMAFVGLLWLSELLGTLGLFEDAPMIVGAVAIASGGRAHRAPGHLGPRPGTAGAGGEPGRLGLRRDRQRGGCRRLDGPDARQPRRRHGPRRHPLVPHAAGDEVRPDRSPRDDLPLRPDLLRLVLPGELRGRPRGRHPRVLARHRLAAHQPRVAGAGAAVRLLHRAPVRGRAACR